MTKAIATLALLAAMVSPCLAEDKPLALTVEQCRTDQKWWSNWLKTAPSSDLTYAQLGYGANDWTTVQQSFPASMSDAEIMKDFQASLLLPRPTFSLGSSLRAHAWNVFGGLALFISGLSILGWFLLFGGHNLRHQFLTEDAQGER